MPLPQHMPFEAERLRPAREDESHHFEAVHGDVAALHARIEQSFSRMSEMAPAPSPTADLIETTVQALSRAAGYVAFAGALGGIAWMIL